MGKEIERKFLVKNDSWLREIHSEYQIRQGYLSKGSDLIFRVRIKHSKAFLTIKSKVIGITRSEFEYEIPLKDGLELIDLCAHSIIEKTRYEVQSEGLNWEIDVFKGNNEGLVVAEIELTSEDQKLTLPEWIGEEVSFDHRYLNSNLIEFPYNNWDNV